MDALFQAVGVTSLNTNVLTILSAFVGIGVLFVGYRYLKKTFASA